MFSEIRCPKCGEITDMWEFDDPKDRKLYATVGCKAVGFGDCSPDPQASPVISAIAEIMGDDIDGISSMLGDAESFGLL